MKVTHKDKEQTGYCILQHCLTASTFETGIPSWLESASFSSRTWTPSLCFHGITTRHGVGVNPIHCNP